MKRNFLQFLFLGVFGLALLYVPGYWISLRGKFSDSSSIEKRPLATFPLPSYKNFKLAVKSVLQGKVKESGALFFNQFIDRSFQKEFESAAADQFPFRITVVQTARSLERGMIRLAYLFLSDPAIPTDAHSNLYVMRDSSRIIYGVNTFSPATKASIDVRIKNYADLLQRYPDQKFYLFYFQRLADSAYHPLLNYFKNPDAGQSFQYFKDNKPQGLILSDWMITGMDDHIKYFYKTDHHWNIQGGCHGYQEIYKMLAGGFPAISPALECDKFITIPKYMYLGSLARETLYPIQPEKFEIADVRLPPYRVITNGQVVYHDGNHPRVTLDSSKNPYRDLYLIFSGPNVPLEEYVFDNQSHRNAIIIGDSYVNPIEPYLAYHYNHTYFVDLRGYDNFSLGALLREYQVDDVIIIGDTNLALTDNDWIIHP